MGPTDFKALQFHFHWQSEHTVDDHRFDLEMHTVHVAEEVGGIAHAAIGIMFDTKNYTPGIDESAVRIIDDFFESLQWDNTSGRPNIDSLNYGELMTMVNFDERWTYRGSVTTPPCARFVHWNVLSTVYPIKAEHLALFKGQLARDTKQEPSMAVTGNWRVVQPVDFHNVKYVSASAELGHQEENTYQVRRAKAICIKKKGDSAQEFKEEFDSMGDCIDLVIHHENTKRLITTKCKEELNITKLTDSNKDEFKRCFTKRLRDQTLKDKSLEVCKAKMHKTEDKSEMSKSEQRTLLSCMKRAVTDWRKCYGQCHLVDYLVNSIFHMSGSTRTKVNGCLTKCSKHESHVDDYAEEEFGQLILQI